MCEWREGCLHCPSGHMPLTKWLCHLAPSTDFSYESSGVPQVVCRQLGFSGGEQYFFDNGLPAGNDSVLTGALLCNGSEARLAGARYARCGAAGL